MKKVLKFTFFLCLLFFIVFLMLDKPLPSGEEGLRARNLTEKIQKAVNKDAWDTTNFVKWTFQGKHHYMWDRKRHLVQVQWDNYMVLLNPNTMNGKVFADDVEQ